MLRIIDLIQNFITRIRRDRLAAYSGQSAYFIILSALPFVLFLLTLVQHLPIPTENLMDGIYLVIPDSYQSMVHAVLNDIHVESGAAILSASVIIAIWTSGKAMLAISDGLNSIQGIEENRNYIILRLKAAVYTLLFAIVIIFTIIVLVFGNQIYEWIRTTFPSLPDYSQLLGLAQSVIAIGIYVLIFTLFYKFLPAKRMRTLEQIPGAVFTTVGWMLGSYIFSLYVRLSASTSSYMYGSLANLIFFFFYLYILMYIFFLGAEVNSFLFPEKKEDFHLMY